MLYFSVTGAEPHYVTRAGTHLVKKKAFKPKCGQLAVFGIVLPNQGLVLVIKKVFRFKCGKLTIFCGDSTRALGQERDF